MVLHKSRVTRIRIHHEHIWLAMLKQQCKIAMTKDTPKETEMHLFTSDITPQLVILFILEFCSVTTHIQLYSVAGTSVPTNPLFNSNVS